MLGPVSCRGPSRSPGPFPGTGSFGDRMTREPGALAGMLAAGLHAGLSLSQRASTGKSIFPSEHPMSWTWSCPVLLCLMRQRNKSCDSPLRSSLWTQLACLLSSLSRSTFLVPLSCSDDTFQPPIVLGTLIQTFSCSIIKNLSGFCLGFLGQRF